MLDNAGFHIRPNLAVPDSIRLVYRPPYNPELQPAETLWRLVDELLVNTLVDTIGARCRDLTERQGEISSHTASMLGKGRSRPRLSQAPRGNFQR